jgi:SOS-response transcriptional repressor LexA
MPRPRLDPSAAEVLTSLAAVIDELGQRPTRKERKDGWHEATRSEVAAYIAAIRDDIESEMAPHPRDLPSRVEVLRWLDAMGVSVAAQLTDRVMDAFALARRLANRARLRAAR